MFIHDPKVVEIYKSQGLDEKIQYRNMDLENQERDMKKSSPLKHQDSIVSKESN